MEVEYIKGLGCPVNIIWGNEATAITITDAKQLQAKLAQVIEQAEKEPELSEFEHHLCEFAHYVQTLVWYHQEQTLINEQIIKGWSEELLILARKELEREWPSIIQTQSFNAGLKQGKDEALKDLPKWERATCELLGTGSYIRFVNSQHPMAYVESKINKGDWFIRVTDLVKLPGFKED